MRSHLLLGAAALPAAMASHKPHTTITASYTTLVTYTKSSAQSTSVEPESALLAASGNATAAPLATGTGAVGSGCTVTAYAGLASAVSSCSNIVLSGVAVPASSTLDLSSLQTGAVVTFAGKTTFGTTANSDFDPIVISGDGITITGAPGHVIDGNGPAYWDGKGSNGGSAKPDHFIVVKDAKNAKITNLNIKNWPVHCFDITGGSGLTISGLNLDNSEGDAGNAAHNSDGFDISSSDNVNLSNTKVHNQDDCVAVTSGSKITVDGMYCYGGHGLSIGSIGGKSDNTVDGVTFSNSQVVKSSNGVRIKTNSGTTGTVSNITYKNITMSGITDYGLDIQQDYLNGGPTGKPTNGVKISGVVMSGVTGTVSGGKNYYILCGEGSCSDFTFTDVSITGGSGDSCNFPSNGTCPGSSS